MQIFASETSIQCISTPIKISAVSFMRSFSFNYNCFFFSVVWTLIRNTCLYNIYIAIIAPKSLWHCSSNSICSSRKKGIIFDFHLEYNMYIIIRVHSFWVTFFLLFVASIFMWIVYLSKQPISMAKMTESRTHNWTNLTLLKNKTPNKNNK